MWECNLSYNGYFGKQQTGKEFCNICSMNFPIGFVPFYIGRSPCYFKFDEAEFYGEQSVKKMIDSLQEKAREAGFVLKQKTGVHLKS